MAMPKLAGRRSAAINVTPLVDVCLVLLIIFLAASRAQYGYEAAIPRVGNRPTRVPPPIRVQVGAGGVVRIDGEPVDFDRIDPQLRMRVASGATAAVLDADDDARYGSVMAVADRIHQSGARIGIDCGSR